MLGVETDIDYVGFKKSRSVRTPYGVAALQGLDINDSVTADYLGTLRGRLRYASGTFLLYTTGGLAYTTLMHSHDFSEFTIGGSETHCTGANWCDLGGSTESKFKVGWTIGGGLEWAYDRSWSLKAEYQYADLGKISSTTNYYQAVPVILINNSAVDHSANLVVQTARVGINYRF